MIGAGAGAGAAGAGTFCPEPEPEPEPECFPGAGAGAGAEQKCHGSASLLSRVVTCDVIDSCCLHSVRSPSRPWQGANSVPDAGERRC